MKKKKIGVPTASLSFLKINCQNGTWYDFALFSFVLFTHAHNPDLYIFFVFVFFREEIPITLSNTFLISIPVVRNAKKKESECGEDIGVCYSGQSLSKIKAPEGCEVNIISEIV